MSFTGHLILGFSLIALIVVGVATPVIARMQIGSDEFARLVEATMPISDALESIERGAFGALASTAEIGVITATFSDDRRRAALAGEREEMAAALAMARSGLASLVATTAGQTPDLAADTGAVEAAMTSFVTQILDVAAQLETGETVGMEVRKERLEQAEHELVKALRHSRQHSSALLVAGREAVATAHVQARFGAFAALTVVLGATAVLGWFLTRDYRRVVAEREVAQEALAEERIRKQRFHVLGQVMA
ncbi:MAG: hypothetical protein KDC98_07410, partial [Planctomycetes bacterium]|nr:hypothetical protein [Planctomycetota bacterium]